MRSLVSQVKAAGGNCGVGVFNPALAASDGQAFAHVEMYECHSRSLKVQVAFWLLASQAVSPRVRRRRQRMA